MDFPQLTMTLPDGREESIMKRTTLVRSLTAAPSCRHHFSLISCRHASPITLELHAVYIEVCKIDALTGLLLDKRKVIIMLNFHWRQVQRHAVTSVEGNDTWSTTLSHQALVRRWPTPPTCGRVAARHRRPSTPASRWPSTGGTRATTSP